MSDEGKAKKKMKLRRHIVAVHPHENDWLVWKMKTMSSNTHTEQTHVSRRRQRPSHYPMVEHAQCLFCRTQTDGKRNEKIILWNSICGTRPRTLTAGYSREKLQPNNWKMARTRTFSAHERERARAREGERRRMKP